MQLGSRDEQTVVASQLRLLKEKRADTSVQCEWCGGPMRPEHAHYRCTVCGQRDSCCDGGEQH